VIPYLNPSVLNGDFLSQKLHILITVSAWSIISYSSCNSMFSYDSNSLKILSIKKNSTAYSVSFIKLCFNNLFKKIFFFSLSFLCSFPKSYTWFFISFCKYKCNVIEKFRSKNFIKKFEHLNGWVVDSLILSRNYNEYSIEIFYLLQ
jgi:hypothetical protein